MVEIGQAKDKGVVFLEFLLRQGRVWGLVSSVGSGTPLPLSGGTETSDA